MGLRSSNNRREHKYNTTKRKGSIIYKKRRRRVGEREWSISGSNWFWGFRFFLVCCVRTGKVKKDFECCPGTN